MAEIEKPKPDYLKWTLIIINGLSIIALFGLNIMWTTTYSDACFAYCLMGLFYTAVLVVQLILITPAVIFAWLFYNNDIFRKNVKINVYVSIALTILALVILAITTYLASTVHLEIMKSL